ncbi:plant UBX domain-containing protein 9-like isoform X1 [Neltuma alba]|uniref:plant UBX domain-containing protein 9-like isoform X1 n=1 Tax=Neltuma alba TaxID=207710 RepID=UPI0010A3AD62|nr:plant UBX domain-containing protein 9-like isoform X1 [Prosopis alba]XP_028759145.1 plant UBX domain-containing protein 9-like isoform X1 [Prosopis alba]
MATPTPEAIENFMRITGSSQFVAIRKLEEYGGNLNEAVNAHFIEGDKHIMGQNLTAGPQYNHMDVNNQNHAGSCGLLPLLSAARRFRPSLLLDSNYRRELRDLYNRISAPPHNGHAPYTSHPGEVRGVPVGINSTYEQSHYSGLSSSSVDVTGNPLSYGQGIYGANEFQSNLNLTQPNFSHIPNNATEEAMIQAAIEASKLEIKESASRRQLGTLNDLVDGRLPQSIIHQEDKDLARAISLSLKMAEQEQAMYEHMAKLENERLGGVHDRPTMRENANMSGWQPGTSSNRGGTQNVAQPVMGAPLSGTAGSHLQGNEDVFITEEWGNMSSEELNEAVLLETAIFGDTPDHTSQNVSPFPDLQRCPEGIVDPNVQFSPTAASLSLTATRLLREQQDAEYQASLLADKQKELNALRQVETQRLKGEESCKKLERKEEKMFGKKETFLPEEPPIDDENAITIVIRMPDGSRHGRRFLKTDKLKLIFDFIEIGAELKPGTYRIVKSYPRQSFSMDDGSFALSKVGLTSRHEALFLELI